MTFIYGLLSGGAITGIVAYLLKLWLETRIRASVKNEYDRNLEEFKQTMRSQDRVEEARWSTTHDACLEALEVLDAVFSHSLLAGNGKKPVPQKADTAKARKCHNKLIIACKDTTLVDTFNEICFHNRTDDGFKTPPTDLLNRFRNEIRSELGFGENVKLDRDAAWFGRLMGDDAVGADNV